MPQNEARRPDADLDFARNIAWRLRMLSAGDLASMRHCADRNNPARAPLFWSWMASEGARRDADSLSPLLYGTAGEKQQREDAWAVLCACLAILTPKPRPEKSQGEKPKAADTEDAAEEEPSALPLGQVMVDGGDRTFEGDRPIVSETRLSRLLNLRGERRRDGLLSLVIQLSRHMDRNKARIAPGDLANFLLHDPVLFGKDPQTRHVNRQRDRNACQAIARTYYARLDRATSRDKASKDAA